MENSIEFPPLNEEPVFIVALQVIFVLLLVIFGLIGNFSACATVYTNRHLQTIPNFLIVNLSISDILRIALTLSVSTGVLIKREWILNESLCSVNGFYTLTFLLASLMSVTIISANRYFLIVRPGESATFFSKRRTRALVVLLWFLAMFSSLPPNFGWGHYGFFASRATCFIAVGSSYSYTTFLVLAFIATPFSVLIWCYFKIYMAIRRSRRRVMEQGVRTLARALSAEGKESRINKEVNNKIGYFIIINFSRVLYEKPTCIWIILMITQCKTWSIASYTCLKLILRMIYTKLNKTRNLERNIENTMYQNDSWFKRHRQVFFQRTNGGYFWYLLLFILEYFFFLVIYFRSMDMFCLFMIQFQCCTCFCLYHTYSKTHEVWFFFFSKLRN